LPASVIEHAVSKWGLPNGYVLGEEAGGAFFGGLRYGEGMLYTKNAGDLKVFWQGPTVERGLQAIRVDDEVIGARLCENARAWCPDADSAMPARI
jgi:hypothetical protein